MRSWLFAFAIHYAFCGLILRCQIAKTQIALLASLNTHLQRNILPIWVKTIRKRYASIATKGTLFCTREGNMSLKILPDAQKMELTSAAGLKV